MTGSIIVDYLPFNASSGTVTVDSSPWNASPVNALLSNGTSYSGTYDYATGAYSIPNVPAGGYFLQWASDYIWTSRDSVNLGWKMAGRKDLSWPTVATYVNFNVTGLNTWKSGDYLVFHDYNSNLWAQADYVANTGIPYDGVVALIGLTIPWMDCGYALVDTTKGDSPRLVQMVSSSSGSENLCIANKVFKPAFLTIGDGTGAAPSGSFSDMALTDTVSVNYKRSEFTAYRSQYNADAAIGSPFIQFSDLPGAAAHGNVGSDLDVLYSYNSNVSTTSDVNLGTISVPGLPTGFERIVYAGENHAMDYLLPGTTKAWTLFGRIRTYSLALPDAAHPLRPMVSPVKDPRINGTSLFSNLTGVGTRPTIAWTAPDLGTPQGYILYLYRLDANGADTVGTRVARLYLGGTETSVQLPSGILETGKTYCLQIQAVADSTYDPTAAPWRGSRFPYGRADVLSSLIRP